MLARHIFELNFTHCKQKTHRCKDEHFTSSYLLWLVYVNALFLVVNDDNY
uniref:CSON010487 protein n=1 Tax=Culicoides sonorensis TaxID=179676 RepID=A0A336LHY6_CULSO